MMLRNSSASFDWIPPSVVTSRLYDASSWCAGDGRQVALMKPIWLSQGLSSGD
jgi:hypothetical protein